MRKRVDKDAALKLKTEHGLSYREIAAIQGVTAQSVHAAIRGLLPDEETCRAAELFKGKEADITAIKRAQVLTEMTPATVQRWAEKHPTALVLLYNSLFNNERLLRGEATEIIDHTHLNSDLEAAYARLRAADVTVIDVPPSLVVAVTDSQSSTIINSMMDEDSNNNVPLTGMADPPEGVE